MAATRNTGVKWLLASSIENQSKVSAPPCSLYANKTQSGCPILAIYAPMLYTAPCVMFLMRADTLRGQVGGGWALEIETFLGPVKWHRADRQVPFWAHKTRDKHRLRPYFYFPF